MNDLFIIYGIMIASVLSVGYMTDKIYASFLLLAILTPVEIYSKRVLKTTIFNDFMGRHQ